MFLKSKKLIQHQFLTSINVDAIDFKYICDHIEDESTDWLESKFLTVSLLYQNYRACKLANYDDEKIKSIGLSNDQQSILMHALDSRFKNLEYNF